ncbi:MAG: GTPase HflX [Actinobacteria bacterium]|nr:MAG: GTPase HflX [Actinomycetota bacterium]
MRNRPGSESPLSATWRPAIRERALLVGLTRGGDEHLLDELAALARAAGAEPVGRVVQSRTTPDPATFVGKGKLAEVHDRVHESGADAVLLDDEATPGQLRNLEERLQVKVLDRTALILDIFALHATSGEGKAQVELAQLNYLLPRLRGWGEAMSRLGGGIGTRGPGETKLEVDRQHIRRRITKLRGDIRDLARSRRVKRSLMNALTDAGALVAGQPFATLDPRTRRLTLPGGRHATLSDTVGFVRKLPHELIEAFKSTLEEVARADLVLHVADASAPDLEEQMASVREVLGEIGAGALPEVLALNKWDLLDEAGRARLARRLPDGVPVSALLGEGVADVLRCAAEALPHPPLDVRLLIPYDRPEILPSLYRRAEVLVVHDEPRGQLVEARVSPADLAVVGEFILDRR